MSPAYDDQTAFTSAAQTASRLEAIEAKLRQVEEASVSNVDLFNTQLEQISTTLAVALGLLTQEFQPDVRGSLPTSAVDPESMFRVVTHIHCSGNGTRLVTDITWPDMWSVRLFAAAMLRTLAQSSLVTDACRCWCEVWQPDESGTIVDSAYLQHGDFAAVVEWESDLLEGK